MTSKCGVFLHAVLVLTLVGSFNVGETIRADTEADTDLITPDEFNVFVAWLRNKCPEVTSKSKLSTVGATLMQNLERLSGAARLFADIERQQLEDPLRIVKSSLDQVSVDFAAHAATDAPVQNIDAWLTFVESMTPARGLMTKKNRRLKQGREAASDFYVTLFESYGVFGKASVLHTKINAYKALPNDAEIILSLGKALLSLSEAVQKLQKSVQEIRKPWYASVIAEAMASYKMQQMYKNSDQPAGQFPTEVEEIISLLQVVGEDFVAAYGIGDNCFRTVRALTRTAQ